MDCADLFAGAGGTTPRIGSLFSGIGGLDLGVEAATGGRTVWQVERDSWCRTVLAKHWPDARRFDDVCAVGEELEPVDVICGGFPCQDVSVAGKRKGLAGERSGLWSEYARIVRVVRPRIVFVENVAGLLSMEFGRVLGDLAALGFDAEWAVFRASDAGAPHRRERVFVLAVADCNRNGLVSAEPLAAEQREGFADVEARTPNTGVRSAGRATDMADAERVEGRRVPGRGRGEQRAPRARCSGGDGGGRAQPGLGRVVDGLPSRLDAHRWPAGRGEAQYEWEPPRVAQGIPQRRDRLKALGNAVVPQQALLAWRELAGRYAASATEAA